MKNSTNYKRVLFATLFTATAFSLSVHAADVTVGADVASAYVWRGITFNDEGVIQPSVDISSESGIGINVWGNFDLGDYDQAVEGGDFQEIDLTLSYAVPVEGVDLSIGLIDYLFPGGGEGSAEVYASLGKEIGESGLSLGANVYYDFDEVEDVYANITAAYGFDLSESLAMELSGSIGTGGEDATAGTDSGLHDYNLKLSATQAASESTSVGLYVAYTGSADSAALPDQDVDVYGGGSVYHSF